jgi:hypothetical protein
MRWFLLIPAVGLFACSDAPGPEMNVGPLLVEAEAVEYLAGTTAGVRLTNLARIPLIYAPCFSRLERRTTSELWIVTYEDPRPCPAVLEYLEPGASVRLDVLIPAHLPTGVYRLRFPSIGITMDDRFVTATHLGDNFFIRQSAAH